MALTKEQLLAYIETELPDGERIPMSQMRKVLGEIVDNSYGGGGSSAKLYREGYEWIKGDGKTSVTIFQTGDRLVGVGNYYPNYYVDLYCYKQENNDSTDLLVTSSEPLP